MRESENQRKPTIEVSIFEIKKYSATKNYIKLIKYPSIAP